MSIKLGTETSFLEGSRVKYLEGSRVKFLEGSRVEFLEGSRVKFQEGSCVKLKFESIDHDFYNCVCRMLDNFGKVIETIRHCRSHARMQKRRVVHRVSAPTM